MVLCCCCPNIWLCVCCLYDADVEKTQQINRRLREDRRVDDDVIKLLFLGAGGSGKSTIFKQLRLLHSNGLRVDERKKYISNIYLNIVEGMQVLVDGNYELYLAQDESPLGVQSVTKLCNKEIADHITKLAKSDKITNITAKYFKQAWEDPGIQQTWENRSKLQVQDSVKYFIEHIDRIATENYIPDKDDVLHVRNRTSGIVEQSLSMQGNQFLVVDVGGQRSERRKWANCFSDVTAMIFVASLASYNQLLFEDETTNRMEEALRLFERTLGTPAFTKCCIILFLNKSDLFTEKIGKWHITSCFPHYRGPLTESAQYEYIKSAFTQLNRVAARKVFVHRTCATDTTHIKKIFDGVHHQIIDEALKSAGLIVVEVN
jgi:guanine nucleotide-binding protein G(i) subunit alpha